MAQNGSPNPVELFSKATEQVKVVLSNVKQAQLGDPTPCSEWTVKDLISHLIGGAEHLTKSMTGDSGQIDFGSDHNSQSNENDMTRLVEAYQSRVSAVLQAAADPKALETNVPTPMGDMTAGQFMIGAFMDQLIHTWDLAKATGQDTRLAANLVEVCYAMAVPGMADMGRSAGMVGPVVEVASDAGTQDKLLGYFGRHP